MISLIFCRVSAPPPTPTSLPEQIGICCMSYDYMYLCESKFVYFLSIYLANFLILMQLYHYSNRNSFPVNQITKLLAFSLSMCQWLVMTCAPWSGLFSLVLKVVLCGVWFDSGYLNLSF